MPTITTTVTSACASGVTTTQTTTEATPDTGVPTNSAAQLVEEMVGVWGSGGLKATDSFFSPAMKIHAGPGKVVGWGSYDYSTFQQWLDELNLYNFNGMKWTFYPRPGGAVGEWTVDSLERKSDGKKTIGYSGCNFFDVDSNNQITGLKLICDFSILENAFSSDVTTCEQMVTAWATGDIAAMKSMFADSLQVDAGNSSAPGFQKYTMATFENWIGDLEVYEFNDMDWTYYACPGGAVGEWTVSSMGHKTNGKKTGPQTGVNRFTVVGGKITNVRIHNNHIKDVEALFN